jgi:hypothetical protein
LFLLFAEVFAISEAGSQYQTQARDVPSFFLVIPEFADAGNHPAFVLYGRNAARLLTFKLR